MTESISNTASSGSNTKQIRPKIRSRTVGATEKKHPPTTARLEHDGGQEQAVEETRQRMESWMGLGNTTTSVAAVGNSDGSHAAPSSALPSQQHSNNTHHKQKAKSILKTPKYSKMPQTNELSSSSPSLSDPSPQNHIPPPSIPTSTMGEKAICKDVIVERDPTKPMLKRKIINKARPAASGGAQSHHPSAVEGYVPSSASLPPLPSAKMASNAQPVAPTSQEDDANGDGDDDAPLILNSLEDVFKATGELPPQHDPRKITADTQLLEADVAFSVMTQNEYDSKLSELREQHEEERQAQLRVFMGTENIFETDNGNEIGDDDAESDNEDDDDDLMEMLLGGADGGEDDDDYFDEDGDDQEEEREPRAFRLLWDTLSEWITPEAVQYIDHITAAASPSTTDSDHQEREWKTPVIERNDVEASRCAGLMAMVKLYLPKCLEELGFPSELRRTADTRLGELLRTFCYVQEAPKLPVKLWKAMTCILLEIVLVEQGLKDNNATKNASLPPSVASVDMTMDEYHYLSRSAVKTFGLSS